MADMFNLSKARSPEEVGVDSQEIVEFFEDMKENELEFHSFMVIRNGKIACEFYREPFDEKTPHEMFSVSKSLTSTAVGIAISEGYFNIDSRIVDIFPEYANPKDKKLSKLRVRHLLSMTSGKLPNITYNQNQKNWVKRFMEAPWYGEPGEYKYVNENIYMLSAIIYKKTGMTLRDYLKPRFFEPLGIDVPQWKTDENGIECGGWGAYLKLQDLAKMMYCYEQGGKIGNKQIIPESWAKTATEMHVDNSNSLNPDCRAGYGYCFWRNAMDQNSYRADGLFSQFGIVFEKYNAVFVCTGAIPDEEEARNCIWRHFPKAFIEPNSKIKKSPVENFDNLSKKYPVEKPLKSIHNIKESKLNNCTIKMQKKVFLNLIRLPVSALPVVITFRLPKKVGNIDNINFTFLENECTLTWNEGQEKNTVICGMDGHLRYGKIVLAGKEFTVCCNAFWENESLNIHIRPIKTIAKRNLKFTFNGNLVQMVPTATPNLADICDSLLVTIEESMPKYIYKRPVMYLSEGIIPIAKRIFEPVHRGRLVKRK